MIYRNLQSEIKTAPNERKVGSYPLILAYQANPKIIKIEQNFAMNCVELRMAAELKVVDAFQT